MKHMRIVVTRYGGPDALALVEEERPEPEAALDDFAHGKGEEPEMLKATLEVLRLECDELFAQVLEAVKAAQAAGVR